MLLIVDSNLELTHRLRLSQLSVHFKTLWPMVIFWTDDAVRWRHVDWHGRCDFLRRGSA